MNNSVRFRLVITQIVTWPAMHSSGKLRFVLKLCSFTTSAYYTMPILWNILNSLYYNFFFSSVSFNLDTLYLDWNTTFPAVTVCEIYNGEKVWDLSEEHFGANHDLNLDDFAGEIAFFHGICATCEKCGNIQCPTNFTQLLDVFRIKCAAFISNCNYSNKAFDCCKEFLPIRTEYGFCFTFNSNQARRIAQIKHANNRLTGAASLMFEVSADAQLHVHPSIEIPYLYAEGMIRETLLLGSVKEIVVNVMELHNHANVEPVSWEQRHCRFSAERTDLGHRLGIYEFYSYSTCIVECSVAIGLARCNCTSHMLASAAVLPMPMCDVHGLSCLTRHFSDMLLERKSCDCLSSCDEPEYNIVYSSPDVQADPEAEDVTHVRITLVELPTQRYVRRVTKNNLDLLISVGGTVGLFFNASIIRVVEVAFQLLGLRWGQLCRCRR